MKRIGAIAVVLGAALAAACGTSEGDDSENAEGAVGGAKGDTSMIPAQAKRIGELGLKDKAEWFKNTPFSAAGIPMIMFRLFPEFAKEIGDPELQQLWGDTMEDLPAIGLHRNSTDGKSHALALGLGYIRSAKALIPGTEGTPLDVTSFQVAGLTCGACHISRIQVGNEKHFVIGNGNIEFDPNKFGDALFKTVSATAKRDITGLGKDEDGKEITIKAGQPAFTGAVFRKLVGAKSKLSLWEFDSLAMKGQQDLETLVFENTLTQSKDSEKVTGREKAFASTIIAAKVKKKVLQRQGQVDKELGPLYSKIGAPESLHRGTPGRADALGKIAVIAGSHALAAAPVDLPAVWRQVDHEYSQFDGSIRNYFFRNLAASTGVSGSVAEEENRRSGCNGKIQSCTDQHELNTPNAFFLSTFVTNLEPPKWGDIPGLPAIDAASAKHGEELFAKSCASCHSTTAATATSGAKTVRIPLDKDKGADGARANQLNTQSITDVAATLQNACENGMQKFSSNGITIDMSEHKDACKVDPKDILFNQTADSPYYKAGPGYVGQRLNGIAFTAPYLHNGSVPNLRALLVPSLRAKYGTFKRGSIKFDPVNVGYVTDEGIQVYDTKIPGNTNQGHSSLEMLGGRTWEDGSKDLTDLLNYMKTL